MREPSFTYGRLDEWLSALGFTARTQKGQARIYRHEQTGARIFLPDAPFEEEVLPHHLAVVRRVLEEYTLGDVRDIIVAQNNDTVPPDGYPLTRYRIFGAMSQTLTISDTLYHRLETAARQRGLTSIEQLLELWQTREVDLDQRRQAVQHIDSLRAKLMAAYGELPDSTDLIREDRER